MMYFIKKGEYHEYHDSLKYIIYMRNDIKVIYVDGMILGDCGNLLHNDIRIIKKIKNWNKK